MKRESLFELLRQHFGLIQHNAYHFQVPTIHRGVYHNIWIGDRHTHLKYLRPGHKQKEKPEIVTARDLLNKVRRYQHIFEGIVDLELAPKGTTDGNEKSAARQGPDGGHRNRGPLRSGKEHDPSDDSGVW